MVLVIGLEHGIMKLFTQMVIKSLKMEKFMKLNGGLKVMIQFIKKHGE